MSAATSNDGSQPHYGTGPDQFPSSSSYPNNLNRLRLGSMNEQQRPYVPYPNQQQSPGQYVEDTYGKRTSAPEGTKQSQRQNSVDSLNFANLNLNEQRQRRPSAPTHPSSTIGDYTYPARPSSRNHITGSPAQTVSPNQSRAPSRGMTSNSYYSTTSVEPQQLTYGSRPQETLYEEPGQMNPQGNGPYGDFDPSSAYASSTSLPTDQAYPNQYGDAYNQNGQPQQGQNYFDPNTGIYAPGAQYPGFNPQTQQYEYAGPSGAFPQQQQQQQQVNGPSQGPYSPNQYGGPVGYGLPPGAPQGGYYEYPGEPSEPQRTVSTGSSHHYSNSGGGSAIAPLPPLNRNRTTASTKTTGSSSSRQEAPSISKQAVDDYRNRIKSDPDPETQFNFARFLIEAARRLAVAAQQGSVDDAKSVKKYRDSLLQEALKLVKRLATQGSGLGKPAYADAQFFLANCLGHGALGLAVDHEKAYNLYVQASKQNHPAATYRTAVCNEVGAGTRRDPNRAVLFYRKASALGDTAGMYKLGMILLKGLLGQPKNPREAVGWLKKAAAQADEENPHALHELGCLYEKQTEYMQNGQPVPSPVMRDEAAAREYFTQAAQLGHAPSQYKLGACYEYGTLTCPVDPRRSIAWYTRAAEKGHAESELALSGWYLTGSQDVLKQSDSEAYLWARRAANKGLSKAEYAVGYYSEVGIGVKADVDEAKVWYLRAAASGNRRAMQRLSELKKLGNKKGQQARPTRQQAQSECIIS